jgi:hypothetical protein
MQGVNMYCCHLAHWGHQGSFKNKQNANGKKWIATNVQASENQRQMCVSSLLQFHSPALPVMYQSNQDAQILNSNSLALKGLHHLLNHFEGSQVLQR